MHWRRKWQPTTVLWRIPGTGEPGGLPSMGSHRVGHDGSDLAAAAGFTSALGQRPPSDETSVSFAFQITLELWLFIYDFLPSRLRSTSDVAHGIFSIENNLQVPHLGSISFVLLGISSVLWSFQLLFAYPLCHVY